MSITSELREWWVRKFPIMDKELHKDFTAIADRIDAEHERAEQDLIDANNQMEQLCECSVELPKDADGVPIRIGDVMAYADNTKPMEAVALVPPAVFLTEDGPRYADMCRHYHKPTVEDVLAKFALAYEDADNAGLEVARIIAEYAAKLKLAEGEGV